MIRGAVIVLAAAVLVLAWTAWRAIHLDMPDPTTYAASMPGTLPETGRRDLFPARRLLAAVDKDPFHPDRRRPTERFRIPSDRPVVARAPQPAVRVVGTAVGPDGGFAMCSWAGAAPRIVRVGDRLGGWTLSKVTPGAAEFTGATGSTMVVRVAKAGS